MSNFKLAKNKNIVKMFRRDNTILIYVILVAIFLGIIFASFFVFYNNHIDSNTIQSGVYIKGTNISGLSKEEAIEVVNEALEGQMNDNIVLMYQDNEYYVAIEQIDAKFDVESSVEYAYNIGRSSNLLQDVKDYISVLMLHINIEPTLTYDDEALTSYLETIETYLPDQLVEASYYIEDDQLIITNGANGAKIKYDELKEAIIEAIQDISYSDSYIMIPTYTEKPSSIDLVKIHDEVYKEVQDAYFTTDPYAVYPEVTGVDFSIEEMQRIIGEDPDAEEYAIDLVYTEPSVTVQDFGMEAFPDLLGSYSTKYSTSNTDRTTNLKLAAAKINGTVVMPGEIFSYNATVGKRTIAAGYKEAAIYQDGEVVDGLGGGICQISTTLYNAVIDAGMLIEERRNHQFVPSYIDAGMDATVVWGSTDFKFENRRDYPVKLEATVSGGIVTIKVYGLKTNEDYDIYNLQIETNVVKSTSTTLVVESYRTYRDDNGNLIKKDKLYTDTYSVN